MVAELSERTVAAHPLPEEGFCGMEVNGIRFVEKAEAGEAILAVCKANQSLEPVPLGSYRGSKMELTFDSFQKEYLIREKIPFMVDGKQIYLPFLAVYLQERCSAEKIPREEICAIRSTEAWLRLPTG